MATEEELQTLLQQADEIRGRLDLVSRQLEILTDLRADKRRAHDTLQGVAKAKPGDEILFPVGGNTFITAQLGENQQVLKGIGAEFAMPRPLERAVTELKGEMDTLDSDIQSLQSTARQLEARYNQIADVLQSQGVGMQQQA